MTTKKQVNTVKEHINDALDKGAVIYAKSKDTEESKLKNSLSAMVLTSVNHDMKVMKEETFSPVLEVMQVNSMDEAVSLANDSNLGLNGSIWSKDRKKYQSTGPKNSSRREYNQ